MKNIRKLVLLVMLLAIIPIASIGTAIAADSLYIGDGSDDTVRQFDADTGNFIGNFVSSGSGGLHGPRGLLFKENGNLLVVNQNQGQDVLPGEVLRYNGKTGVFETALVPSKDPNAPYAPRGIVLKDSKLFVADMGDLGRPGKVSVFDEPSGKFLGNLDQKNAIPEANYHPRGIVFGPDGNLYVSVRDLTDENIAKGQIGGHVLRFTPSGKFVDVFIADDGGVGKLNRPEGLVFGPDGKLYITSYRDNNNPKNDTDSIMIYSSNGDFLRKIDLYPVGTPNEQRAYAQQALLFGSQGSLFVPIYYPATDKGEVRKYNVANDKYDSFVKVGETSKNPWFLTFGKTDPSTLAYRGK
jgi:DNA-binding beta-propeller fold protein YncE